MIKISARPDLRVALTLLVQARRLLKSMSIKQGVKYDSPESAREIPAFIEFHNLKIDEIADPLDSFSKSPLICSRFKILRSLPFSII